MRLPPRQPRRRPGSVPAPAWLAFAAESSGWGEDNEAAPGSPTRPSPARRPPPLGSRAGWLWPGEKPPAHPPPCTKQRGSRPRLSALPQLLQSLLGALTAPALTSASLSAAREGMAGPPGAAWSVPGAFSFFPSPPPPPLLPTPAPPSPAAPGPAGSLRRAQTLRNSFLRHKPRPGGGGGVYGAGPAGGGPAPAQAQGTQRKGRGGGSGHESAAWGVTNQCWAPQRGAGDTGCPDGA